MKRKIWKKLGIKIHTKGSGLKLKEKKCEKDKANQKLTNDKEWLEMSKNREN